MMITKVNIKRSNKPSSDEKFGEFLFSVNFSGSNKFISEISIAGIIKT